MMGWGWDYANMMNSGFGFLGFFIYAAVFVDLVLLGIWLWKKIQK